MKIKIQGDHYKLADHVHTLEMTLLWIQRYFQETEPNPQMVEFIQDALDGGEK